MGNRIDLGQGNSTTSATYNMSEGLLDMSASSDSRIIVGAFAAAGTALGQGAKGVFIQTGGLVKVNRVEVTESAGTTGTVNLFGGVLETSQIFNGGAAGTTTASLIFDGGTVRAKGGGAFITGFSEITVNASGATIDSNDQVIQISAAINGSGKLTKLGGQALTLQAATNNYAGGTVVNGGGLIASSFGSGSIQVGDGAFITLTLNTAIADVANLSITGSSTVNLDFTGVDVIGALSVNGNFAEVGIYTADELNQIFGGANFQGSGSLSVTAFPEPATWILLGCGMAFAGIKVRTRCVSYFSRRTGTMWRS